MMCRADRLPEVIENGPKRTPSGKRIVTEFDAELAHHSLTISEGLFGSIGVLATAGMAWSGVVNSSRAVGRIRKSLVQVNR